MALEQHSIPTQVTSYEFRLVGDMTLKQFAWLASGIIIAIIIYSLPLPGYIRWPLILLFTPAGALIAFVPIEGRGIDRWIVAFIKAIYSPTEFMWHQEHPVPEFFYKNIAAVTTTPAKITTQDESQLEEYLGSLPKEDSNTLLDQRELDQLSHFDELLNTNQVAPVINNQKDIVPDGDLSSSGHVPFDNMTPIESPSHLVSSLGSQSPSQSQTELEVQIQPQPVPSPISVNSNTDNSPPPIPPDLPIYKPGSSQGIIIPDQPKKVETESIINNENPETKLEPESAIETKTQEPDKPSPRPGIFTQFDTPPLPKPIEIPENEIQFQQSDDKILFSQKLPMPIPTQNNIISGMVTDAQNKIIENVIIEIKDQSLKPVRALKTNKLGQFSIATPLKKGRYTIEIDKSGYKFNPVVIDVQDQIIEPIAIRAVE